MTDLGPRLPDPRMIPRWKAADPRRSARPEDPGVHNGFSGPGVEAAEQTLIRPFFLTGGRTRPLHDGLRLHTLVTAPPAALHAPLRFELRRIVELCQRPKSVAEIAAGLRIPVGVARVLIADLVTGGYVAPNVQDDDNLPVEIIERIRDRVRAL